MRHSLVLLVNVVFASIAIAQDTPKASDPRLVVELVAAAPDIVHPISCDFDAKGRLLVIESHTHFAPKDYKGPKFDRIQAFDVARRGKPTTFFEGTRHTMDLAVHPDGSVYVATRNEILRLRDTKGTGVADEKTRIVFLDTKGDYPHNGLSGLCFDSKGDLIFGMGENLGAAYKLIGSDKKSFSGQGDGGHIFHCTADGKNLRRIATGFWNPFGNCRDIYGRLFCVDNDPDQAPPCRMLHVVEGGDYGFRFMYGRSGKHPFQSWHGQLPGTLPMMTGVGEAPCEVLSYESDGLPAEYRGQLLVTSWADHRVERYAVKPHGASFKGERLPFVQGGNNFRPTGMCVAPDGSLYVADWVLSNYTLHGKGAIWHIRWKDAPKVDRPSDRKKAIFSMHRPLREAAAKKLASDEKGRNLLRSQLGQSDVRMRATALVELINTAGKKIDLGTIVEKDNDLGIREVATRAMVHRGESVNRFADRKYPATVRALAIENWNDDDPIKGLGWTTFTLDRDPFVEHAVVMSTRFTGSEDISFDLWGVRGRISILLAYRRAPKSVIAKEKPGVRFFLNDPDETVRFLAVKWVADEKLADYRKDVEKAMQDHRLSVRMYMAYATALARLNGQEVSETKLADYFAKRLVDDKTPLAQRAMLLRQVPASHKLLTVDLLAKLLKSDDAGLKMEAVRALVEHPNAKRDDLLLGVVNDTRQSSSLRAWALVGISDPHRAPLYELALGTNSALRDEALRGILSIPLTVMEHQDLLGMAMMHPEARPLVDRIFARRTGKPFVKDRPPAKDIDGWLKRLEGKADADAGGRIFFHPKLGSCSRCHRIDGRGKDVGPDLSSIGRTDRRHLLEAILQPSNTVAPHYQVWHLETTDGKTRNGMLIHTQLDEYTYLDAKAGQFKVKTGDIVETRPIPISIMPDGLVDTMTDQELRDLLAYLGERK